MMSIRIEGKNGRGRRGSAAITALLVVVGLIGLSAAILSVTLRTKSERVSTVARHEALATADSGISHAISNLVAGAPGDIGTPDDPVAFGDGSYWVTMADNQRR